MKYLLPKKCKLTFLETSECQALHKSYVMRMYK